ncbi:MAG TPA: dTMP kinase [Candidatus Eisenbacteria bacterium]
MPGVLVTFEGGEGSGKSTQVARLAGRLRGRGLEPVVVREPGGTPFAEAVRSLLLDSMPAPNAVTEALLVEAARADLVLRRIRPSLETGHWVLCDRFTDSTLAYQGAGRGLELELLAAWNRAATGDLKPDFTLLLDVDPALGLGRRARDGAEPNRLDREPLEFHRRVRECFLSLARKEPRRFVVLDGALDVDRVEALVWSALEPRLTAA